MENAGKQGRHVTVFRTWPRFGSIVWCFIGLWALALTLLVLVLRLEERMERFERTLRRPVVYDWNDPTKRKEEDDARHHLDKSDER